MCYPCVGQLYKTCATSREVAGLIPGEVIGIFFFRPHCGPGVDSASPRKEYQGYLRGIKAVGV